MIFLWLLVACSPEPVDSGGSWLVDGDFAFEIEITEWVSPEDGSGSAWATVSNRELEADAWELEQRVGDCGYFEVRPYRACDPVCGSGFTCTWDGECVEASIPVDAGVIEVDGLAVELVLEPTSEWVYYGYDFDPEPTDGQLFDEGAVLTAVAEGADLAAFSVEGLGVAPMDTDLECPPSLNAANDLALSWTPGSQGDTVQFTLQSGNHGGQFPALRCETEDDGALTVDAELISAWLGEDRPVDSWSLTRSHEGRVEVDGLEVVLSASGVTGCSW